MNSGEYPSPPSQELKPIGDNTPITVGLLITMLGVAGTFGMAYQRLNNADDRDATRAAEISSLRGEVLTLAKDGQQIVLRTQRLEDSVARIERGQDRMERKLDQLVDSLPVRTPTVRR